MIDRQRRPPPDRLEAAPVSARIPLWLAAFALFLLPGFTDRPSPQRGDWVPVTEGVAYRQYVFPRPNHVFVSRMDLSNPHVILDTAVSQGEVAEGKETVSGMVARSDGALNAWGGNWGTRNRVVAAINGSSFDLSTGVPLGGQLQSGWMIQHYTALAGGSGVVWTSDRDAFVGGYIQYNSAPQSVTLLETRQTLEIDGLNTRPDNNGLWLYTPQFGPQVPEGAGRILVRIEVPRPLGIQPERVTGTVRETAGGNNALDIPFGHVVLAARGRDWETPLRELAPGDRVGFSSELIDLSLNCRSRTRSSWEDAYASLGGGFVFLREGDTRTSHDTGENLGDPRTAICLNEDFLYFVVVDGRQDGWSVGMALGEVADFCREELDAEWGINQDGGGSSAMWVDGWVRNRPSDGSERAVGNAWLMISLEPARRSRMFEEGFRVRVQDTTSLRLGPGTEYAETKVIPAGEEVTIAPVLADVQGVFARGSYWWRVSIGEREGWLPQEALMTPDSSLAVFTVPGKMDSSKPARPD